MKADPATVSAGVVPFDPASPDEGGGYAEGGTVALTYRELADRLGVAVEAAKARARRGGWTRLPGNDKLMRVQVPAEALRVPRVAPHAPLQLDPAPDAELPIAALRAALDAQAEAHRAELARLDATHRVELERVAQAHAAELARCQAMHRAELERAWEAAAALAWAETDRIRVIPGLWRWLVRRLAK